jgi:WD40 repeat protein
MYLVGVREDRVDIWNTQTHQHLTTLTSSLDPGLDAEVDHGFDLDIYGCSNDGRMLALLSGVAKRLIVMDISKIGTGAHKELYRLTLPRYPASITFMTDNERVVVGYGDTGMTAYDAVSGSMLQTIEGNQSNSTIFTHATDDGIMTFSHEGLLQEWDSNLTEIRRRQADEAVFVQCACLSPVDDELAFAVDNGSIKTLDLITCKVRYVSDGMSRPTRIQYSSDGSMILSCSDSGSRIIAVDIENEAVLFEFDWSSSVCYNFDSTIVFGSQLDGRISCFDAETGSLIPSQFHLPETICDEKYANIFVCAPFGVILM